MVGGGGNDFGTFHCEDVSVVNGAQTVGTVGKFGEANPGSLQQIFLPVRIIVRGEDHHFGQEVTRTNNRQNRIENRDFVALDPEQTRIRTELAIDGIDYQLMRSETVTRSETAFDLVEGTTALACASGTIRLPVQAKREIGKLWDDIAKAPYKELFNPNIPGLYVWRCVQIQRRIDRSLDSYVKRKGERKHYAIVTHGNRLISALVFGAMPVTKFREPGFDIETVAGESRITSLVDASVLALASLLETYYPNSIIPTLFKNLNKCEHLAKEARPLIVAGQASNWV